MELGKRCIHISSCFVLKKQLLPPLLLSRHLGQGTNSTMSQRHDQVQNKLGDGNSGFLSPTASISFQNVR